MKRFLLLLCVGLISSSLFSQNTIADHWFDVNENAIVIPSGEERTIIPKAYRTVALDLESLKTSLADAPMEFTSAAKSNPIQVSIPLPSGEDATFEVFESPCMPAELAAKFPEIKSFAGYGVDDPSMYVRFDYGSRGFRGILSTPEGQVFINPYVNGNNNNYISYYKKDRRLTPKQKMLLKSGNFDEHLPTEHLEWLKPNTGGPNSPFKSPTDLSTVTTGGAPVDLRVYRLAIATTGEFSLTQGGTLSAVMSELVYGVNRVNFIFERETAVRFELVANNDEIIYLNPSTDPFDIDISTATTSQYLNINQGVMNTVIGAANYDIGHVFAPYPCESTGNILGSGGLSTVCNDDQKARGVSCTGNPNESFYIEVFCHEIGHQLSAPHTWNNCTPDINMTVNYNPAGAYSPGGGTTIMSYAGACGDNNVQFGSDWYLHVNTIENIQNFTRDGGGDCAVVINTDNIEPEVTVPLGDGLRIPISTPFQLTAVATDANVDDTLTYCWEQYNLDPIITQLGSPTGNEPSFRTYFPTESGTRIFPRIQTIINNQMDVAEVLPTYTRNLTFRCTARDNKWGGGGTVWEEISFNSTSEAGPFLVSYPNEFTTVEVGQSIEVTWDVANTDGTLVNCQRVNILLSTNGGFAYPHVLAANVPNDGSHTVVIPDAITNIARVKVEAADNIFFDISNLNFRIDPPSNAGFAAAAGPYFQKVCLPNDPTFEINTISMLDYDSLITLEAIGLPADVTADFSATQILPSESSTLTLSSPNTPNADGSFGFQVMAYVPDEDTVFMDLFYEVAATDFSDFVLASPTDGMGGVDELPLLEWNEGNAADEYDIQISDDPSFTSLLEEATVTGESYVGQVQLELGGIYFYRIRPKNECATGDWSERIAFAVKSLSCANIVNDNELTLPSSGSTMEESIINVPNSGIISDLNIANITGNHQAFKDIGMRLVGPDGTSVQLFGTVFCQGTQMDFGMDDEAPFVIGVDCPVNTGNSYKPQNELNAFNDKDAQGEWKLQVDIASAGNGGKINEWTLQICSEANLSPPSLVVNETMPLPPGVSRGITEEFLLTTDPNNSNDEISYTIVTLPQNGKIMFGGTTELGIGDKFTQQSSSAGNISYEHDGSTTTVDSFLFTVDDSEGGLIATPQFNIVLDPNVMISTEDILNKNTISIFPNPARDLINIDFSQPINERINVRIFNVQGQLLAERVVDDSADLIQMETKRFANGIYFVQVRTESDSITERVTIQK